MSLTAYLAGCLSGIILSLVCIGAIIWTAYRDWITTPGGDL